MSRRKRGDETEDDHNPNNTQEKNSAFTTISHGHDDHTGYTRRSESDGRNRQEF